MRRTVWVTGSTALTTILLATVLATAPTGSAAYAGTAPDTSGGATYVALGDSYASAPRVGAPTGPPPCRQATDSYPHVVARMLGVALDDRSCAGASTANLTGPQTIEGSSVPAQLGALGTATRLVTLGIGANDGNVFGNLVLGCGQWARVVPTGDPCTVSSSASGQTVAGYRTQLEARIAEDVLLVERLAPNARVLVVGYPQFVPSSGSCPQLPLDPGDYPLALAVNQALDDALRLAAQAMGVGFIDIWDASKGHDICSGAPWIAGDVPRQPAVAYHPYWPEQAEVAGLIEQALGR
ncbi:MAG: SGNH/GDSL hydrolase family protein [Nocardioidaceae bacterium]|nr:SGNH/GDSL hydrolase family protein [Nocardioidaceae bacterium]MCL2613957.1 SGNH/GDSL hydrolase family protein [Nocardioidaceae bacterium]